MSKIDPTKLKNTLDFILGFILPVTVVYEQSIEREAAIVGRKGMQTYPTTVHVRVENRNNWINVLVVKPGGASDVRLTDEASKMATAHLEKQ